MVDVIDLWAYWGSPENRAHLQIVDKIEEITKEVGIFGGVPEIPTLFFDYVVGYSTII